MHITSIVGRYLEHARIYLFGRGEEERFYIASADLMTRNLNRRVEIACPITDPYLKGQLKWILQSQLRDTAKACFIMSDGSYGRKCGADMFDSQAYFMEHSPHTPVNEAEIDKEGVADRLKDAAEHIKALFNRRHK